MAHTPGEVAELLQDVSAGSLPAYAVRRSDVTADRAWNGLKRAALASGLAYYGRPHELTIRRYEDGGEFGLSKDMGVHIETAPCPSGPVVQWVQAHQVLQGAYRAMLLEVSREHGKDVGYSWKSRDLPEETEALLEDGFVDPSVLQPKAYLHEGEPGDILIFRAAGHLPVAHQFVTTEYPRSSRVLTYTPGVDMPKAYVYAGLVGSR